MKLFLPRILILFRFFLLFLWITW